MNEQICHMYHPYHPAVLRMLRATADAAHTAGIDVSVCGEMAGDERAIPLWLELGIRHLSMSPQSLLRVKHRVLNTTASTPKKKRESASPYAPAEILRSDYKSLTIPREVQTNKVVRTHRN